MISTDIIVTNGKILTLDIEEVMDRVREVTKN